MSEFREASVAAYEALDAILSMGYLECVAGKHKGVGVSTRP